LDIDKDIQLNRLDTNGYDIVSLKGERFCFANKKEGFIEKMSSYFPKEKDNLARYYNLITQIAQASSLHTLNYKESDNIINTKYQTQTINEVIGNIIKDKLLQNVLVGNLPLYAGVKDRDSFFNACFHYGFL
jgi:all-trans-retinol 13,14-reductase